MSFIILLLVTLTRSALDCVVQKKYKNGLKYLKPIF